MTQPAIAVENLCKSYGPVQAVDDVSFRVEPGELVGFLGLNGAGKSTTMRILTTYLPASSGYARVAGFDVMYQSTEVRRSLGYLPESVPLYPEMRVDEYLQYRAKLKGVERAGRGKRIEHCMDRCRVREVRRRLLGTLSKGYRQRVGLADTLLADPPVLILDEPTAGLDPVQIKETLNVIRELGGRHTVLLSSHILSEVEEVCDRVIIITRGRVTRDGKLSDIRNTEPTYLIEVRGPADRAADVLRHAPGVAAVEAEDADPPADGVAAFAVRAEPGRDVREALAEAAFRHGLPVRRLELRREKLEDLFLQAAVRG